MPTVVQSLLRMYRRGVVTDREVMTRVIDLAAEADVAELTSQLPTDLLASMRRVCDESLTTEEGWGRMLLIHGGTFASRYVRRWGSGSVMVVRVLGSKNPRLQATTSGRRGDRLRLGRGGSEGQPTSDEIEGSDHCDHRLGLPILCSSCRACSRLANLPASSR